MAGPRSEYKATAFFKFELHFNRSLFCNYVARAVVDALTCSGDVVFPVVVVVVVVNCPGYCQVSHLGRHAGPMN